MGAMAGREVRYHFTASDRLWLARALWGEGGRPDTVAWTMGQRFALLWPRFGSFAQLVQMYNKSISPRWTRTGDKCRPGGRYHGTPHCSPRVLGIRDRKRSAPWAHIPERFRRAASDFVSGRMPNPVPGAVHFATSALVRRKLGAGHRDARAEDWRILSDIGGHAFVTTSQSRAWTPGAVQVSPLTTTPPTTTTTPVAPSPGHIRPRVASPATPAATQSSGGGMWLGLAVVAALGAAAVAVSRTNSDGDTDDARDDKNTRRRRRRPARPRTA